MRKHKKILSVVSAPLIVCLSAYFLLCCCLTTRTRAATPKVTKSVSSHCHSSESRPKEEPSDQNHSCECCKMPSLVENKAFLTSVHFAFLLSVKDFFVATSLLEVSSGVKTFFAASHSPPGLVHSDQPLYLKHSVFRI